MKAEMLVEEAKNEINVKIVDETVGSRNAVLYLKSSSSQSTDVAPLKYNPNVLPSKEPKTYNNTTLGAELIDTG
jgi:hypothetical protein